MKTKNLISIIIFTALLSTAFGFCLCFYWHNWDSNQRYVKGWSDCWQLIPTREELQQRLVSKGYNIGTTGADGVIGPNTIDGWKQAENDRQAEWSMCNNVREFDEKMLAKVKR